MNRARAILWLVVSLIVIAVFSIPGKSASDAVWEVREFQYERNNREIMARLWERGQNHQPIQLDRFQAVDANRAVMYCDTDRGLIVFAADTDGDSVADQLNFFNSRNPVDFPVEVLQDRADFYVSTSEGQVILFSDTDRNFIADKKVLSFSPGLSDADGLAVRDGKIFVGTYSYLNKVFVYALDREKETLSIGSNKTLPASGAGARSSALAHDSQGRLYSADLYEDQIVVSSQGGYTSFGSVPVPVAIAFDETSSTLYTVSAEHTVFSNGVSKTIDGAIYALKDADGDGRAEVKIFAKGIKFPYSMFNGIAVRGKQVFVSLNPPWYSYDKSQVLVFEDRDGDGESDFREVFLSGDMSGTEIIAGLAIPKPATPF